jgi:hypothetical protein
MMRSRHMFRKLRQDRIGKIGRNQKSKVRRGERYALYRLRRDVGGGGGGGSWRVRGSSGAECQEGIII